MKNILIPNSVNFVKQKFSTLEQKLLTVLLMRIQSKTELERIKELKSLELYAIEIPFSEIGEKNYERIKEMKCDLTKRQINYASKDKSIHTTINIFQTAESDKNENTLYLEISSRVIQLFTQIGENTGEGFTSINAKTRLSLSGAYAIRFFDLLSSKIKLKSWEINISELRELLDIGETQYLNWGQFNLYVLQKAKKEIEKKSGLRFTWEITGKQRKKVTKIKFHISEISENGNDSNTPHAVSDNSEKRDNYRYENEQGELFPPFELNLFNSRPLQKVEIDLMKMFLSQKGNVSDACNFTQFEAEKIIENYGEWNIFYVYEYTQYKKYTLKEKIYDMKKYVTESILENYQTLHPKKLLPQFLMKYATNSK